MFRLSISESSCFPPVWWAQSVSFCLMSSNNEVKPEAHMARPQCRGPSDYGCFDPSLLFCAQCVWRAVGICWILEVGTRPRVFVIFFVEMFHLSYWRNRTFLQLVKLWKECWSHLDLVMHFLVIFFAECVLVIVITITSIVNSNYYIYLDKFDHRFMKAHQYEWI